MTPHAKQRYFPDKPDVYPLSLISPINSIVVELFFSLSFFFVPPAGKSLINIGTKKKFLFWLLIFPLNMDPFPVSIEFHRVPRYTRFFPFQTCVEFHLLTCKCKQLFRDVFACMRSSLLIRITKPILV